MNLLKLKALVPDQGDLRMYKSCSENLKICAQCAVHEVSKFCKGPDFTVNVKMTVWDR